MKILNFGSLNIDHVYRVDHFVRKGETLSSESLSLFCGGKGLNQSVALGRAGAEVYHAGSIGTDGQFLLDLLTCANVDVSNVAVLDDVRTGNAIIQNDAEGDNCIILYGGANRRITQRQIDRTLAGFDAGDFLVLQNEVSELAYLIAKAHEKRLTIVLNPSPMDEKVLEARLDFVDWFLLNEIEAGQITESTATRREELVPLLRAKFPTAKIVLTLGAQGSCYLDAQREFVQGVCPVKVVDTTAAGDTFTGYFLAEVVRGHDIEAALALAAKASALTVSRPGAAPSIPTLQEVEQWPVG